MTRKITKTQLTIRVVEIIEYDAPPPRSPKREALRKCRRIIDTTGEAMGGLVLFERKRTG